VPELFERGLRGGRKPTRLQLAVTDHRVIHVIESADSKVEIFA
jgi:hypothetical protein